MEHEHDHLHDHDYLHEHGIPHSHGGHPHTHENTKAVVNRLARIIGHLESIKRMAEEGHTVAIHCNRHEYGDLYSSVDGFLKDFNTIYNRLYELTGQYPQCFRFPGGSNNAIAERHNTTQEIIDEMTARGFDYYDWNAYTSSAATISASRAA